jgi:hypothetical protein
MKWLDIPDLPRIVLLCIVVGVLTYAFVVASPRARAFLTDDETMPSPRPDAGP